MTSKQQHPPRKPPPSLFSAAIHQLQISNPVEFQLPEDIRSHFKDGELSRFASMSSIYDCRFSRNWAERQLS